MAQKKAGGSSRNGRDSAGRRLGVKLLLDEQISGRVAERLRTQGHDVIATAALPEMRGLSDPDLFEAAQEQERAIVTYNRADFEAMNGLLAYLTHNCCAGSPDDSCSPGAATACAC